MIPRRITTFWFSEDGIPEHIEKCINSQKEWAVTHGYVYGLLTLDFLKQDEALNKLNYVQQCLNSPHESKKWVKLTDYLRMVILELYGGWSIDADVELLPGRGFSQFEHCEVVVGDEGIATIPGSRILGSAVVGAERRHPMILKWIKEVETNFRGDDELCYESSMDILNKISFEYEKDLTITAPEVFYPKNSQTGELRVTENTVCIHHFGKSWIDAYPKVAIFIPTLGRLSGLLRLTESIKKLNYPQDKIHRITHGGGQLTVPEKVNDMMHSPYVREKAEYICYMANDTEFTPDALSIAIAESAAYNKALVAFNTGELLPDEGNACEHFIIRKEFVKELDSGQIFSTDFIHVGCDNWLWEQAKRLGQAYRSEKAKVIHHHFSTGAPFDEVYKKAWQPDIVEKDRETLKRKLATLEQT